MSKRKYIKPVIALIRLDNQISLALESLPPAGPEELVINENSKGNDVVIRSSRG
jgi:hypothetical protein